MVRVADRLVVPPYVPDAAATTSVVGAVAGAPATLKALVAMMLDAVTHAAFLHARTVHTPAAVSWWASSNVKVPEPERAWTSW